jgi:hypothetical protein
MTPTSTPSAFPSDSPAVKVFYYKYAVYDPNHSDRVLVTKYITGKTYDTATINNIDR